MIPMIDALRNIDTRTHKYDHRLFEDYGFAISVGQSALPVDVNTAGVHFAALTKRVLDELITWLRGDLERNTLLVEAVLMEIAFDDASETIREINSERIISRAFTEFKEDISRLTSQIASGKPLTPSDETIRLAQRVVEIEPDTRSIEEWADTLSTDVSRMDD